MQLPFSTSRTADTFLQEDIQCRLYGAFRKKQCSGEAEGNVKHQGQWADSVSLQKTEKQMEAAARSKEPSFKPMGLCTKARPRLLWQPHHLRTWSTTASTAQLTMLDRLQLQFPLQDFGFIKITGMLLSDFGINPYWLCECLSWNHSCTFDQRGWGSLCRVRSWRGSLQSMIFIH